MEIATKGEVNPEENQSVMTSKKKKKLPGLFSLLHPVKKGKSIDGETLWWGGKFLPKGKPNHGGGREIV